MIVSTVMNGSVLEFQLLSHNADLTWKLCMIAKLISTRALSFHSEDELFVLRFILEAIDCKVPRSKHSNYEKDRALFFKQT